MSIIWAGLLIRTTEDFWWIFCISLGMYLILAKCVSQCKEVVCILKGKEVIALIQYTLMILVFQQIMWGEIAFGYISVLRHSQMLIQSWRVSLLALPLLMINVQGPHTDCSQRSYQVSVYSYHRKVWRFFLMGRKCCTWRLMKQGLLGHGENQL